MTKTKKKTLRTPEQILDDRRKRKRSKQTKELRALCLRKINKFCGKPIEIPVNDYFTEVVDVIEKELKMLNWKVTRQSEFQGENPIMRLAMR